MAFKKQPSKPDFYKIQEKLIDKWENEKTFETSVETKSDDKPFRFYDWPPFPTWLPHYGSLLSSICKDVVPRYQTMKWHKVERNFGRDCHGIYVEQKVQEKFGIKTKDIEKYWVKKFIEDCYEYNKWNIDAWPWYINNIGRWVDMFNDYKTQDIEYMESVLRVFKQLWDKGLVYEWKRVSMFSTALWTPISNFEVAMDDTYEEVNDPAITVEYDLSVNGKKYENTYILVWTTTPWTIPANIAAWVHKDIIYNTIVCENKKYIVAKKRVEDIFKWKEFDIVDEFEGTELIWLSYKPPYDYYYGKTWNNNDHKIYYADFATDESWTGIVHEAPEFWEVDFQLAKKVWLTITEAMNDEWNYTDQISDKTWMFYRDCNDMICKELAEKWALFHKWSITHRVAFCPRSNTPLVYKAQDSWFVDIQSMKKRLLSKNQEINRFPSHFKDGRFAKSLEWAPDRCISRTRYRWTPMPVWIEQDDE